MGFSKYPNELDDSSTLPPSTDLITPVKAEVVNRLRDALLAVEMELDAQPSGAYGTVRARLDDMQAQITTGVGGPKIVPGVAGYQDTAEDSWQEIGALMLNPLEFPRSTLKFEAIIQTTIIAKAVSIQLYNISDGTEVANSTQTSTSLIPELVSVVLTVPADLPNGEKLYTVRIKMAIAGGPNERGVCKTAHIKVS